MKNLIINIAKNDERIRAVLLSGSRANSEIVADKYQDYDITYFVKSAMPFYNNALWLEKSFGKPLIMQMPDICFCGDSGEVRMPDYTRFAYLVIFDDGNRLDLTVRETPYIDEGEPAEVWLDKDGILTNINPSADYWHIKKPTQKQFADCCNEFWWCLNNVAKGIARNELPYAMEMMNKYVRDMLNLMVSWHIGVYTEFSVSAGKGGKYFEKYLSPELYKSYTKTYSSADYTDIWRAVNEMCSLFRTLANSVACNLNYAYNKTEDDGIMRYIDMVKTSI